MSRVSLSRRMDRLRDAVLPPGSMEWRIERLPDDLKRAHLIWQENTAAITLRLKNFGANPYEALLAGANITPPMPTALEAALWPDGRLDHSLPADCTLTEAADSWAAMMEEGRNDRR